MRSRFWSLFSFCLLFYNTASLMQSSANENIHTYHRKTLAVHKKDLHGCQEVHIPFTLQDGAITVNAVIDGQNFSCIVDTGTSDIVWPQSLKLKGSTKYQFRGQKQGHKINFSMVGPTGFHITGQLIRLPLIKIGDYQIVDTDTVKLPHFESDRPQAIILGNKAFDKVVITIDYKKQQLVIRKPNYRPLYNGHSINRYKTKFTYVGTNYFSPGRLIVPALIKDHPCHLILDTGLEDVLLSQPLAHKLWPHQPRRHQIMRSPFAKSTSVNSILGATVSVGGAKLLNQEVFAVSGLQVDADGSIGRTLFKSYRVTIDYPRHKILLEPYFRGSNDSIRKEGKLPLAGE